MICIIFKISEMINIGIGLFIGFNNGVKMVVLKKDLNNIFVFIEVIFE